MRNTHLPLCLVIALLLGIIPQRAARAQTPLPPAPAPLVTPSGYTVGACASVQPDQLRAEIEAAAAAAIASGDALDIDALVARKWAELDVDSTIDAAVADAVARVQADEGYWSRLLSGWSAQRAEEFAARVAADAFSSETFNSRVAELSGAIGEEIARAVNARLGGAAGVAFLCLRDYVGQAYTDTLFAVFAQTVTESVDDASVQVDATLLGINALDTHAMGLVGAGLVVAVEVGRRVSFKLSEKIAQRVAGKVVGRVAGRAGATVIPAIGWIVGVGMIVYDLVEGGRGALPQIEEGLTSVEVKERIRADIVEAVRTGLPEESAIAALETAVTMLEKWDAFCTTWADVCALAQENPSFAHLLSDANVLDVARLEQVVDLFLASFGRERLDNAIASGAFDQLLALPQVSQQILRETGSVETTLAWAQLAGNERLNSLAALGIHTLAAPQTLDAVQLDKLIATADAGLVQQLLLLDTATRDGLLELPVELLRSVALGLPAEELGRFVRVMRSPEVTATPSALFAQAVLSGLVDLAALEATPAPPAATPRPSAMRAAAAAASALPGAQVPGAQSAAATVQAGAGAQEVGAAPADSRATAALMGGVALLLAVILLLLYLLLRRKPTAR